MSKVDALRAMREARYEEDKKRAAAAKPKSSVRPSVAPASPPARQKAEPVTVADPEGGAEELCGHRNMGGRTCTRERGHTAKSHRYS